MILEKPKELRRGDVVLALVKTNSPGKHYVVHRIVSLNGEHVVLMGDGNLALREYCDVSDVCAKVICVVKPNGKKYAMAAWRYRIAAKIWYILLPIRRYLLWIYRKVIK